MFISQKHYVELVMKSVKLKVHGCLGATYGVGAHFDISKRDGDKCIAIRFICRVMNFAGDSFEFRVSSTFMTDSI